MWSRNGSILNIRRCNGRKMGSENCLLAWMSFHDRQSIFHNWNITCKLENRGRDYEVVQGERITHWRGRVESNMKQCCRELNGVWYLQSIYSLPHDHNRATTRGSLLSSTPFVCAWGYLSAKKETNDSQGHKIDGSVVAGRKQKRVEVRLCSYLYLGIGFLLEDFGIKKL